MQKLIMWLKKHEFPFKGCKVLVETFSNDDVIECTALGGVEIFGVKYLEAVLQDGRKYYLNLNELISVTVQKSDEPKVRRIK